MSPGHYSAATDASGRGAPYETVAAVLQRSPRLPPRDFTMALPWQSPDGLWGMGRGLKRGHNEMAGANTAPAPGAPPPLVLLLLNIRGLGSSVKTAAVGNLLRSSQNVVLGLTETHLPFSHDTTDIDASSATVNGATVYYSGRRIPASTEAGAPCPSGGAGILVGHQLQPMVAPAPQLTCLSSIAVRL